MGLDLWKRLSLDNAMLAFFLHTLSPFIVEVGHGIGLRWYGLAYVLAFVAGFYLYRWLACKGYTEMPPDKVGDFITWGAIFGVMIGGRLGQMLFYDFGAFLQDPLMFFRVWEGGMSSHGGMLGLVAFTFFYSRKHQLSWTSIGDSLCVVAPIGLFFGRIANFINGELYGRVSRVPWAVQFPKELYEQPDLAQMAQGRLGMPVDRIVELARTDSHVQEVLRSVLSPRHPSQIYEALLEGVLLFALLWALRTKTRQPRGVVTGAFFALYAILRIIGEMFREPEVYNFGFTRGQFLSGFLILMGAAFILWGYKTRQYERAFKYEG